MHSLTLKCGLAVAATFAALGTLPACNSPKDEAADVALLCEPPSGDDTSSIMLRAYPAAAGYAILDERLKSSRWKKWMADVDTRLSTKTYDAQGATLRADELDAAGKSAGYPSCWASAAVRRFMEKRPPPK